MIRRLFPLAPIAVAVLAASCGSEEPTGPETPALPPECTRSDLDAPPAPAKHTPRWAFEPWISKDISTRADTYEFVDGFRARGIPVGVVVLDSPWETHYNTFVPSPTRYADFPGFLRDMHDRNVRVVLWVTQMTNETGIDVEPNGDIYTGPASNFEEGERCNYYVEENARFLWWKGSGCGVDFFNPHARAWWHRQQDPLLAMGIDGWKLDFGENYFRKETIRTAEGERELQEYSERYYEDFLAYGQSKRGKDFITMVRAWDKSYEWRARFFAKKEHAPVAWMGDNIRDYRGLADALNHTFISAAAGYPVVGSDIGGYLDRNDQNLLSQPVPFDTLVFARWIASSAMTPFMQLHGRANLTPWTVADNIDTTVAVYKYWATLHHELVPFFYSLTEEAWAGGAMPLRPIGDPASWPGDYRYELGDAFLVAPLLDATGQRAVALPGAPGTRWFDWWSTAVHDGGTVVNADYSADRTKIPLFVRDGAIVPLRTDADPGAWTAIVYPSASMTSFRLREDDESVTTIEVVPTSIGVDVKFVPRRKALVLRVRRETEPALVREGQVELTRHADLATLVAAGSGWTYEAATRTVHVRVPQGALTGIHLEN